jgi:hypothetical protein
VNITLLLSWNDCSPPFTWTGRLARYSAEIKM